MRLFTNHHSYKFYQQIIMSFKVVTVVLGLLGCYMAVPLDQLYDPQSFYSSHRIVGGIEAPDGSAPYMVALLVGDIVPSLMCGGSLIAPQRMLTAAHCIEPMKSWTGGLLSSARAVLGTNKWSDERRTAQFSGYRIHPEYDRWNIKNDIGLIFTTNEVVLDKRVNIIALNYERMLGGENIIVTGWGTTTLWGEIPDQLQLIYVKVMSPSLCEHAVKEAQGELRYPPVNHEVEICTKHEKGAGHGMCHGDSGSALVDELGKQVGIVSWGWPCARNHPDIHARISAFLDFLSE